METTDLLKDPILTSTNGAHDSSKEVDCLKEVSGNVSDLKEPSILSKKENSPVVSKEFSPLPDRKELSPDPLSKEESSPLHSSKESSPLPLSKEPSPLPARKYSDEVSSHEFATNVEKKKESSPLLFQREENLLDSNIQSALPVSAEKPIMSSLDAFLLSESIDTASKPSTGTASSMSDPMKETDLFSTSSITDTKVFPTSITPEPAFDVEPKKHDEHVKKVEEEDTFGFNKPLPPEPIESTADFLKSETNITNEESDMKPMPPVVITDEFLEQTDNQEDKKEEEDVYKRKSSPSPPPVPKHQNLKEDLSERYEPSQTPEPDFAVFKPVTSVVDDKFGEPVEVPQPVASTLPQKKETTPPKSEVPPTKIPEASLPLLEEPPEIKRLTCCLPKKVIDAIGPKDIRDKIDAWFNPARLHPQVESLIYWRDPKKSGIVFGITMVSLLSLTCYSLITVVAYLCLITLLGTITFRVYKNIMQAVQKTSDGHPFKDLLEIDLTIPEDKVADVSQFLVQYLNTSLTTLRSLFLVEDLIDSIKFVVLLWVLTFVGACFNGLTLIIIGVILLFSLPKVYENNKAQIDIYMKMAMDKLSIITNRMKAAVPEGKKDEKPKDQ